MGRHPKYVNQRFFDQESKAMWYVLGTFYSGYTSYECVRFVFKSSSRGLVEIVKEQLDIEHEITSDQRENRSSCWVQIRKVPHLESRLEELGLKQPKKERRFPGRLGKAYMGHFIRGFLDARANFTQGKDMFMGVRMSFGYDFLSVLHQMLAKYAGVRREAPVKGRLSYSHEDSLRIGDFAYQDWNFIERNGLYLPSKRDLYLRAKGRPKYDPSRKHEVAAKIDEAKMMLRKGVAFGVVSERVGYSHYPSFCRGFKSITGQTPSQWSKENSKR